MPPKAGWVQAEIHLFNWGKQLSFQRPREGAGGSFRALSSYTASLSLGAHFFFGQRRRLGAVFDLFPPCPQTHPKPAVSAHPLQPRHIWEGTPPNYKTSVCPVLCPFYFFLHLGE